VFGEMTTGFDPQDRRDTPNLIDGGDAGFLRLSLRDFTLDSVSAGGKRKVVKQKGGFHIGSSRLS